MTGVTFVKTLRAEEVVTDKVICPGLESCSEEVMRNMILRLVYPVGSIYVSVVETSPSILFGGEWEQIIDRFLYCATHSLNMGGSVKITTEHLPQHTHIFTGKEVYGHFGVRKSMAMGENVGDCSGVFTLQVKSGETWRNTTDYSPNEHQLDRIIMRFTPTGTISKTGEGENYMPPYMTVYAWRRIS